MQVSKALSTHTIICSKTYRRRALFLFVVLMHLYAFRANGQNADLSISVLGKDGPLADAAVEWASTSGIGLAASISDEKGRVTLSFNRSKSEQAYILSIKHLGYVPYHDTVAAVHISTSPIEVRLTPQQFNLNEQVVTAEYAPASTERSINKVTVIGKKQIENMNAVTLRDVLTNTVNIRLGQDNILGSSMALQGISGENIKIMIDGVPVIGRLDGNIDLSQINLNNVARIEIVEGPLSVNYGTNALAGTINIITEKGAISKGNLGALAYFESIGTHNLLLEGQTRILKTDLRMSTGRNYFDGWNATDPYWPQYQKTVADNSRWKQWKPKEQYFGRLNANRTIKGWTTGYRLEWLDEHLLNRGFPRRPFGENALDDTYQTDRLDHALTGQKKIGKHHFNLMAAFNQFTRTKNTYFKDLTTLNQTLTENAEDQDTSNFQQLMSRSTWSVKNPKKWFSYQIGYDLSLEMASGRRIDSLEQQQGDYSLFASAELRPTKSLTFKPGIRVTHNTIYEAPVTPALNLLWRHKAWNIRTSYARGFRAPSLKELYFQFVDINHDIVGNTDLKAEFSHNLAANVQHKKLFKKSILKVEFGGYYNALENLISLIQINEEQQYSYVNVGQAITKGVKASALWMSNNISISISANYLGLSNNVEVAGLGSFNYSGELAGNVQYHWKEQDMRFSVFYKYQGRVQQLFQNPDQSITQGFIDAYHLSDFTVSKEFAKRRLTVATGFKNLFNVQNINMTTVGGGVHSGGANNQPVGTGRTFFTRLSIKTNP